MKPQGWGYKKPNCKYHQSHIYGAVDNKSDQNLLIDHDILDNTNYDTYNTNMTKLNKNKLYAALRELGPRHLKPAYRHLWTNECPVTGYCYVVCELACHFDNELRPFILKNEQGTHWFLKDPFDNIIDYTAEQFPNTPDYDSAKRASFLTKHLSKRACMLLKLYNE